MAITMLIAVGVAFTPVFTNMNPGREFTSGNEIVYKISEKEESQNLENDTSAVNEIAEEMKSRLETYKVEDYSVKVEGNDTIRVALAVNDDTQLGYITRYLGFNGGSFSLAGKEEETRLTADKIFVDSTAYIVRVQDTIPYVIFPVSDSTAVKTLIDTVSKETTDSSESLKNIKKADSTATTSDEETSEPDIFLWANWEEGDTYDTAEKDAAVTGQKIICSFVSSNIWYQDSDEEETELQFLCGYANSDGDYDTDKLKQANQLATYVCNMFNASSYEYNVETLFVSQTSSGVTNNYIKVGASAENLLVFGNNIHLSWSVTLIATLIATVIMFLILVMLYRTAALGIAATTLSSTLLTFALFTYLGGVFNIAAIVGGILLVTFPLAMGVLYMNKLKEEVYKGRALRKANQEAMKKITLPSIDIAVIMAFGGLMMYFLGGNALRPLGIVLFFGAIITLVMIMLVFRLLMWLLTNSTNMQNNAKLLNFDEKYIPNIMQEEKPTYVAPYENNDFTKKRKPVAIVSLVLALASIVTISVFGAIKGSPLNISASNQTTTQIYTSIEKENPTISNKEEFKTYVLDNIKVNGEKLTYSDVEMMERTTYDYQTEITTEYTYFITSIDSTFKSSDKFEYVIDGVTNEAMENGLSEAIENLVAAKEGASSADDIVAEVKESHETVSTPHQGYVALACAVTILGTCLYFAFRYRPSRALAALITSSVITLISYGFFVMCRVQVSAFVSLVMPIATITSLVGLVFYFSKEKEMLKENKSNLDDNLRHEIMVKSGALSFWPLFQFIIMSSFLAIDYFGFGYKTFASIFAGMLLANVLSLVLTMSLVGPMSEKISKSLKKIKLPTIKIDRAKKQRIKLQNKPKTSEPEETVFIGIND